MPVPTGISLATKGVLCGGGNPVDTKYTGFIRKDETPKPIIKLEKFYVDGDDVHISKPVLEVADVAFIEKIDGVINEDSEET